MNVINGYLECATSDNIHWADRVREYKLACGRLNIEPVDQLACYETSIVIE